MNIVTLLLHTCEDFFCGPNLISRLRAETPHLLGKLLMKNNHKTIEAGMYMYNVVEQVSRGLDEERLTS